MSHACVIVVILSWVKVGEKMCVWGGTSEDNGGRTIIFEPRISFPTLPSEF